MGLDMGLSKKEVINNDAAYWRKANQIRKWFVENLENFQDNGETKVQEEDLEKLVDTCKKVLADHSLAEKLLPCSEGFFFGDDKYDEWYFNQLEDTVDMIEKVLNETDWDNEEIYYWEWY